MTKTHSDKLDEALLALHNLKRDYMGDRKPLTAEDMHVVLDIRNTAEWLIAEYFGEHVKKGDK